MIASLREIRSGSLGNNVLTFMNIVAHYHQNVTSFKQTTVLSEVQLAAIVSVCISVHLLFKQSRTPECARGGI